MAGIVIEPEALDRTSRLPLLPFDARCAVAACQELDRLAGEPPAVAERGPWQESLRRSVMARRVLAAAQFGPPTSRPLHADVVPTPEAVAAYRSAMDYVRGCARRGSCTWNAGLVLRVHALVVGSSATPHQFRQPGSEVAPTAETLYVGATAVEVPGLVQLLSNVMAGDFPHSAMAAAWVHVATVAIHPFGDGNGRLGRVLASLAMYLGGFDDPAHVSLEEWWGDHNDEYHAMTGCIRPVFDPASDVTAFVAAHVEAQLERAGAALNAPRRTAAFRPA